MGDKYEREIDEILRRFDDWPPRRPSLRVIRRRGGPRYDWMGAIRSLPLSISPSRLFIASMVLALLGYLVRLILPALAAPLGWLSLAALIAALVLSLRQRRRRHPSGWRGRPIDLDGPRLGEELLGRLRRWRRHRW